MTTILPARTETHTCGECERTYTGPDAALAAARCAQLDTAEND